MALLPILRYPDERLRTVAKEVPAVDDALRRLADDMLETMYDAEGIGLAATQVDRHVRLLVLDVSETRDQPRVFVNPRIVAASDEKVRGDEGCLSVPTFVDEVERHARVTVAALDRDGAPVTVEADGLLAVCLQHEMDHLQGRVFVEYLSPLKRERIRSKLKKREREAQSAAGARRL